MKLHFHGAAGEVTGSCHLLEVGSSRLLLECGLVQGSPQQERRNAAPFAFDPAAIDAVVLSHAHIDHSGRLPLLVKRGYRGQIYTQAATRDLLDIMLRDAAFLQERDAETENRKRARKGLAPIEPMYSLEDVEVTLAQVHVLDYEKRRDILPGVTLRLLDAGHILGSAIVELWLEERGVRRKLVFSGDLGYAAAPILRDPTKVAEADWVLLEGTYGDRLHRSREATLQEIGEVLAAARQAGGNVLIPAFAVGRSQELLYLFGKHYDDWGLEHWRVYLDSPMAIEATAVYAKHRDLYDREAAEFWRPGGLALPNLHLLRSPEDSMQLNRIARGAIIIAGSGMCTGGRIRHHLKNHVWREQTRIVIVGFQAAGTTGRALVDGARHIRLWGEAIRVAARVHTIGGLSAHADQRGLLEWYDAFRDRPPVALVHGEPAALDGLAAALEGSAAAVHVPANGERLDLVSGKAATGSAKASP